MAVIDHQTELAHPSAPAQGVRASLGYFIRRYPLGAAGAVIVLTVVLMAIFAGWITAYDPTATSG